MTAAALDVPVVVLVHRRPAHTRRVLERLREVRPERLFVVADGPRRPEETAACREVRALFDAPGWPCEVSRDFSDVHLGCGRRVASGLSGVFARVERAIVVEDDVLPDASFFGFCRELLDRYRDEERVMQIGGTNPAPRLEAPSSYVFSRFTLPPWGWATWARAWRRYQFDLASWDAAKPRARALLGGTFPMWDELVEGYRRTLRSWDLQWNAALWMNDGVSVVPVDNLVRNIGYGPEATFTRFEGSPFGALETLRAPDPLVHPRSLDPTHDDAIEPAVMEFIREIMFQSRRARAGA